MLGEMDVVRKGGESRQSILLYIVDGGRSRELPWSNFYCDIYIFPTITHIYRLQNHWTPPLSTFSAFYLLLWYIQLFLIWSLYCVELGPGHGFSAGRARGIKRKNISPNYFPHIKGKDILCPPYYDRESKLGKSAPACCRQEAQIFLGIL